MTRPPLINLAEQYKVRHHRYNIGEICLALEAAYKPKLDWPCEEFLKLFFQELELIGSIDRRLAVSRE